MTDETEEPEGESPDGYVIVHIPVDGSAPYGIGPFPPIEEMADDIVANAGCDCKRSALPIAFPTGVKMAVGVDLDKVVTLAEALIEADERGPVSRERLN